MKRWFWIILGLTLMSEGVLAQGITAVTRRTLMGGVGPMGGMGGMMGGMGPMGGMGGMGGGFAGGMPMGGLGVHPNPIAAAMVLLPGSLPPMGGPAALQSVPEEVAGQQVAQPVQEPTQPQPQDKTLLHQQHQAQKGSVPAQLTLGRRYRDGDGVEPNLNLARAWFRAAANQGSQEALKELRALSAATAEDMVKGAAKPEPVRHQTSDPEQSTPRVTPSL